MDAAEERAYWDRHAKNYDRSMRLLGRPLPRMLALIGDAVRGSKRVLEVAGGTGLVTRVLAREAESVIATDYAPEMVAALKDRVASTDLRNVTCEQADIYDLRFESASFDAVVAANVLHLVPDLPRALAAMRRVLAPGGTLVVPTFCHDETRASWLVSRALALTGFPGHRRFTTQSLKDAVESAGITAGRVETIPGVIPIGYVDGT